MLPQLFKGAILSPKPPMFSGASQSHIDIQQPYAVTCYNRYRGRGDLMDQNVGAYRIHMRSKKWWWALFAMLLDSSVQNVWLLYRSSGAQGHRTLHQHQFRRSLTKAYFQMHSQRASSNLKAAMAGSRRSVRSIICDEVRVCDVQHRQASRVTQRRCKHCGKNTKRYCVRCCVSLHDAFVVDFHSK